MVKDKIAGGLLAILGTCCAGKEMPDNFKKGDVEYCNVAAYTVKTFDLNVAFVTAEGYGFTVTRPETQEEGMVMLSREQHGYKCSPLPAFAGMDIFKGLIPPEADNCQQTRLYRDYGPNEKPKLDVILYACKGEPDKPYHYAEAHFPR
jgi:hypothetical protein